MLQKYQPMLQTLLPSIDSQVTALHSLQVFCLSHKFPKGMLLRWFMALYELSIIDEEALMKWKEDVNDAYPGKGQALFQVNLTFRKYLNLYFNIESKLIGMIR